MRQPAGPTPRRPGAPRPFLRFALDKACTIRNRSGMPKGRIVLEAPDSLLERLRRHVEARETTVAMFVRGAIARRLDDEDAPTTEAEGEGRAA